MAMIGARLGDTWRARWRAAPARERKVVAIAAIVVALALLYAIAHDPLTRDIERTRETLERDRATLALLQRNAAPVPTGTAAAVTNSDPSTAVARALESRGLRKAASQLEPRDGRVALVLDAVPFESLVPLLDELARTERLRVVEARIIARVEPGIVRAELTLGR